jgi:Uma2 family endonuclease
MVTIPIPTNTHGVRGPRQGEWTYADWETLVHDEQRYEIIEGALYMSTAPSLYHQWIVSRVYRFVGQPAEDDGLGYSFMAPVGVIMPQCQPVQPDFVFVSRSNVGILQEGKIRGVSDLIVEVLSPGNRDYDEDVKLRAYAQCGVPEYGIVDAWNRQVRCYRLGNAREYPAPEMYNAADTMAFACLPEQRFTVGQLFAGAPDTTL